VLRICVTRAPKPAGVLKPFVACRDLIIVIPLYTWERIRVMTINDRQRFEMRMQQFSGDAGTVSGDWFEERGGACG
jgi:hypothetical protein